MQNLDPCERQLQRVGGNLRQGRFQPLPQHRRADKDADRAIVLDHEPRILLARAAALDERHCGEPVIAAIDQAAVQRLVLVPADFAERALEGDVIVAGVELGLRLIRHQLAGMEWQLRLLNEIFSAEIHRIEAEIAGHDVQQALAEKIRLEPSWRAQCADRRLAGDKGFHCQRDIADAVRPRQELRGLGRNDATIGADVSAHIAADMSAHGENRAVALACNLKFTIDLARMVRRGEMLAAVLDPFHRLADQPRRERNEKILRIELALDAEAAADVDLDHVDVGLGDTKHRRERATVEEQNLGGAEHRESFFRRVPFRNLAAGLQRRSGQSVATECFLARVFRLGEGRFGVAERRHVAHRAVAEPVEQCGFIMRRHMPVRQRRQALDVQFDLFQRILGQRLRLSHHHSNRLADIAHLVLGDDRLQIALELGQVGKPQRDHRHVADLRRRHHRVHA